MRGSVMKVVGAVALVAAAMVVGVPGAGAGLPTAWPLQVDPVTEERAVPTFDFASLSPAGAETEASEVIPSFCADADYRVLADGEDEVPSDDYTIDANENDGTQGRLQGHGLDPGRYHLEISCPDLQLVGVGAAQQLVPSYVGEFEFGRLTVAKVVIGEAPEGTEFVVNADCEGEDVPNGDNGNDRIPTVNGVAAAGTVGWDFVFGSAGGVDSIVIYAPTVCEVTETEDGGADSVDIEGSPAEFDGEEWGVENTVTVTNTFDADPINGLPTPETPETPEAPEAPRTGPAAAAQAVVATPTFTG